MTPPLPDRIAAAIDELSKAACEAAKPHVSLRRAQEARAALEAAIAEVVAERDAQRECFNLLARELIAQHDQLAAANAQRDELLTAIRNVVPGLGVYEDWDECTDDDVAHLQRLVRSIARAHSGQPAQRDDDGTASKARCNCASNSRAMADGCDICKPASGGGAQ